MGYNIKKNISAYNDKSQLRHFIYGTSTNLSAVNNILLSAIPFYIPVTPQFTPQPSRRDVGLSY